MVPPLQPSTKSTSQAATLPLGDKVATLLAHRIIFGDISPGERITEQSVGVWSGASRSPVREALRMLEREGLVHRRAHSGVTATPLALNHLDDIYLMRTALEPQAARLAAERMTAEALELLEQRLRDLAEALAGEDGRAYFNANLAFHEAVYAAAQNELLRSVLRVIGSQALRFRYLAYQRSKESIGTAVTGATRLLDALRARDPDEAETVMRLRLRRSWRQIRSLLEGTLREA